MPQWTHNHIERRDENSEHWIFGFTRSRNNKFETLQLQGENCSNCGEYRYSSHQPHTKSNLKICNC